MAEASDNKEKPISVLLLATKWQFDTYGLSTVNKSLVNNLRLLDSEAKKIKITCAVVEEEGKIESYQKKDAEKYKVQLIGGKRPRGSTKKPNIEWLDENIATYYPDLLKENSYHFIIGHAPYLANGPFNLKDRYPEGDGKPKVILMIHDLPRASDGDIDEDTLLEWLTEADVIFSVGKKVEAEINSCITSLDPKQSHPVHKMYIPSYPLELFNIRKDSANVCGIRNVTMMTGDSKDLEIRGVDFPLAVASAIGASKHILKFEGAKINLDLLTDNKEDKEQWKKDFPVLVQKEEFSGKSLHFQPDAPKTIAKVKTHMRRSNLFILPLKPDSPSFGTEALSAVAAEVPILISSHSGMASILAAIVEDESVVRESSVEPEKETWKDRIIQRLVNLEEAQRAASTLREQFLLNSFIVRTHLDFTRIIVGKIINFQY